ncbi:MAG: serine/threonine protein kinase [Deltaproteobacteria bacterium]|nr:MAG: serine/threonine protein kinase [Deltaproteobacteria bacterium]
MLTKARPVQQFDLPPGRSLGSHYEIVEFLGRGYEGEVYKVVEVYTGIERAAKIFFPQRNPRGRALLRYARKLNKLKHLPIIVQYHHLDTASIKGQRVAFMVSEFVEGEVLSKFVERQPGKRLRSFEALCLLRQLAEGVAAIHQMGEYHGDIHSDNIIVSRRGVSFRIKLLDFFDLGRPTRERIQDDVVDLAHLLYEITGGAPRYRKAGPEIKKIVCGLKRSIITRRFRHAGELVRAIDALEWD